MTPALDVALAVGASALAALWLGVRAVRRLRARGSCGCTAAPGEKGCPGATGSSDLRAVARRAVARAAETGRPPPR